MRVPKPLVRSASALVGRASGRAALACRRRVSCIRLFCACAAASSKPSASEPEGSGTKGPPTPPRAPRGSSRSGSRPVAAIAVRRPKARPSERIDPFTRGPAMHTGLDFKAEYGADARATAAGTVTAAEYSGGYGRMVEIDHGNGLSTRYAHLSSIRVVAGQKVAAGALVGHVGSTGRSTGAHLHYETRIDGVPVDPRRFLRAGARLRGATVAALP